MAHQRKCGLLIIYLPAEGSAADGRSGRQSRREWFGIAASAALPAYLPYEIMQQHGKV